VPPGPSAVASRGLSIKRRAAGRKALHNAYRDALDLHYDEDGYLVRVT
jgi:hypothetical protein